MSVNLENVFNLEVARELLREINESISDETVNEIWTLCNGNPWDAPILYKIIEIKNSLNSAGQSK